MENKLKNLYKFIEWSKKYKADLSNYEIRGEYANLDGDKMRNDYNFYVKTHNRNIKINTILEKNKEELLDIISKEDIKKEVYLLEKEIKSLQEIRNNFSSIYFEFSETQLYCNIFLSK